jgi:hypothetical protein
MLYIGRLSDEYLATAESVLPAHIRLDKNAPWRKCAENIAIIDNLKLASVGFFLDHVAALEGIQREEGCDVSRFRHMPWWLFAAVLPVDFSPPKDPPNTPDGWPVFVGSSQRLLGELQEIQALSSMRLGEIPDGYRLAQEDPTTFFHSGFEIKEDRAIHQWVWRALFDAATLSIEKHAPIHASYD